MEWQCFPILKKTCIFNASRRNIGLCRCQQGTLISFGSLVSGMYCGASAFVNNAEKTVIKQKKVVWIIPSTPPPPLTPLGDIASDLETRLMFEPTLTDTAGYCMLLLPVTPQQHEPRATSRVSSSWVGRAAQGDVQHCKQNTINLA